eukprot:1803702-Lingulodinium_polyedra.AAC.1
MALWRSIAYIAEAKQAPASVLQFRGAACDMAQDILIGQFTRGGRRTEPWTGSLPDGVISPSVRT